VRGFRLVQSFYPPCKAERQVHPFQDGLAGGFVHMGEGNGFQPNISIWIRRFRRSGVHCGLRDIIEVHAKEMRQGLDEVKSEIDAAPGAHSLTYTHQTAF
jgi:hypothetical protein